ncbi:MULTISPECIES: LutC/YkgG family protein [Pelosinus]|jgi:L-lactate dehydrogenase complex protein LldG|uniref:Lactate utilization protein B/C n=1 Tax=Pelosinus fermentans B4 TaxID=1149862 RepID=I9B5R1_9FIRM|nr:MULTISPECIES: lactate utilization protein [Pelosinus]EIW20462.1 Lactate utilization protein B/C [Pelosinus fermentans B4]EIW25823.1 Lactate utilization protein B/C [Pelosinus fermentans A11]OAM93547.1 Lactate utilization protein B/C [Pelosinus fermentans DSM 17108]SDQ81587.1 L-lactate dehydrogenase complex protein LldG [Pelosinus fermentans]
MKKVSTNWKQAFPPESVGTEFFEEFAMRAQNVAAKVFRVKTAAEAQSVIVEIIKSSEAKKVVATPEVVSPLDLPAILKSMNLDLYTEQSDIRTHADTSDIGIACVEFGIAETGSVCEDGLAIEQRLITTLPPISIVVMNSANVVPTITAAFETISKVFDRGYISFITGPSRTSDIERVLTIGVHGPSQLVIIAIDEEIREV